MNAVDYISEHQNTFPKESFFRIVLLSLLQIIVKYLKVRVLLLFWVFLYYGPSLISSYRWCLIAFTNVKLLNRTILFKKKISK